MSTMHENEALVTTIGEYAFSAFPEPTFLGLSATLYADSGEVVLDMDLRSNTRAMRHQVIDTMMDSVHPMFAPDGVSFTFVFSDHEDDDLAPHQVSPDFAVV